MRSHHHTILRWVLSRGTPFTAKTATRFIGCSERTMRRILVTLSVQGFVIDVGTSSDGAVIYESAIAWRRAVEAAA